MASSQIREELLRAGMPADRVRVILNGIDHTAFRRERACEPAARRPGPEREHRHRLGASAAKADR
jgi:hypothetical protein